MIFLNLRSIVICISLLLTFNLLAQKEPNFKWSQDYKRSEQHYELKKLDDGLTFVVHRNKYHLRIDHLDENNEISKSAYFNFIEHFEDIGDEILIAGKEMFVNFFYVEGYYYYISRGTNERAVPVKGTDKKAFLVDYYMYKINCRTLEMEIKGEVFLRQDLDQSDRMSRLHIAVSPNKKKFAIGYHMFADGYDVKKVGRKLVRHQYYCSIYNPKGDKLSKFNHVFTEPRVYFNWYKWVYKLNNNGTLLCSTQAREKFYLLPFRSDSLYEVDIISKLRIQDTSIHAISLLREVDSEDGKNLFCVSYRDIKDLKYISTGFAIIGVSNRGSVSVLSMNPNSTEYMQAIDETKCKEPYDMLLWKFKNGKRAMQRWVFRDFFRLGNKYYLISEYSHKFDKLHISPSEATYLSGGFMGDLLVYRFDSEFKLETSFVLPKFYDGNCRSGTCDDLYSPAILKGYSLVSKGDKLSIYYWNNTNNEYLLDSDYKGTRNIYLLDRKSSDLGLYNTTISNDENRPNHKRIPFDFENPFRVSVNTCLAKNKSLLFYASSKKWFKLAEIEED